MQTLLRELHPEDVRAAIRKRFVTIADFEREKGLPERSVHDILRGRTSALVEEAIESVLKDQADTMSRKAAHPKNERAAA